MKVLKLKDPATFKDILIKRGNNIIVPVVDANGSYVVGYEVLTDPAYDDIVEVILDQCEPIEYFPLDIDGTQDKPTQPPKGEFKLFLEEHGHDVDKAVVAYYDSKLGMLTKMANAVVKFFTV